MSALLVPEERLVFLFTAYVHQICTTVRYCRSKKTTTTTNHGRNSIYQYKFRCPRDARFRGNLFAAEEEVRVLSTSVHGLEMSVDEFPHSARGACPFLCPWSALCSCLLYMYNRTVL
jgi:hypothetical protein